MHEEKNHSRPPHPIDVKTPPVFKAQEFNRMVKEHQQYGERAQKIEIGGILRHRHRA